jgi:thymidylate synthase (FAD)
MKVITEPTVTLISKPQFIETENFIIPEDGTDSVKLGAFAAKVCYDSVGKNGRANELNQKRIIETKHGSVLEHINYSLFIEGITRGLSLESNRHRQLAVSQRSTRYTAEEEAAIVLEPYYANLYKKYEEYISKRKNAWHTLKGTELTEFALIDSHLSTLDVAIGEYSYEVDLLTELNPYNYEGFELRKWARGKARSLLPHALETKITYTGNVRTWRWVIESRSDPHAEDEIRRLADVILQVLRKEAPLYFNDFTNIGDVRGIPVWVPEFSKV